MDGFFSDENIVILQQLTLAGITAAERMALFGVLHFINAQNSFLAKDEQKRLAKDEQKRIALENDFA
jgi:hypothetical protein